MLLHFCTMNATAKLAVLQLLFMNNQTAKSFQSGFTDDEILVLLAESHGVITAQ